MPMPMPMPMPNVTTIDFENLGFASGATIAKRDGAYYDSQVGQTANSPDPILLVAMAATLAADVVKTIYAALQPDRFAAERDTQYRADCQQFAAGFERGYYAALV